MAYDEGLAEILRDALAETPGLVEKRMFGGLAFMLDGNMLCGVLADGGMFRVGKAHQAAALAIEGAREMAFTGRPMGGFVEASGDALADDDRRDQLLNLAFDFVRSLPAK